MSSRAVDATDRSFMTTDNRQIGFATARAPHSGASDALADRTWAMLLQGELEEAVDTLLLRTVLARTPTLSGASHQMFA